MRTPIPPAQATRPPEKPTAVSPGDHGRQDDGADGGHRGRSRPGHGTEEHAGHDGRYAQASGKVAGHGFGQVSELFGDSAVGHEGPARMKKGRARRVKESAVTTIRCPTKNMTRSSPPGIQGMKARQLNPMAAAMGILSSSAEEHSSEYGGQHSVILLMTGSPPLLRRGKRTGRISFCRMRKAISRNRTGPRAK